MTSEAPPQLAGLNGKPINGAATESSSVNGTTKPRKPTDAGTRAVNHYATRLSRWRYAVRQFVIPFVRAETPILHYMQYSLRSPMLDSYFAFTANLGTHTFFMIMLPVIFWTGNVQFARDMVRILAFGVILSGVLKDFLCLPRPHSPPLTRITMSGSAALEYGFPSTHSTNAVSVAVHVLYMLHENEDMDKNVKLGLQILCYIYTWSIAFGRLYCGMHGFFDVGLGSALGAAITVVNFKYGHILDALMHDPRVWGPLSILLVMLFIIRTHPEPADDCPCFDDSVAFAGAFLGVESGIWHLMQTHFTTNDPLPGTVYYSWAEFGMTYTVIRTIFGVAVIIGWRSIAKATLLRILPPIFRQIERLNVDLPRRYFLKASEYKKVPPLPKDDNVIPSASQIPKFFSDVRQRKGRALSIGPQSVADAREAVAFKNELRRQADGAKASGVKPRIEIPQIKFDDLDMSPESAAKAGVLYRGGNAKTPLNLPVSLTSAGMETPAWTQTPLCGVDESDLDHFPDFNVPPADGSDHAEHRELFKNVAKVRVRYDVEVVTKLVVYTGIGWLASAGGGIIFELVGLGRGRALFF